MKATVHRDDSDRNSNQDEPMTQRRHLISACLAGLGGLTAAFGTAHSDAQEAKSAEQPGKVPPTGPLFAVEFRTGSGWDHTKPAHEQAYFRDHSANLKRLRDQGQLVLGARYSDRGFIVMTGESAAAVREQIELDPAVRNQIFAFELHEFGVFYPGCVGAPAKRA
jgi:uncharacterized protein YciI